MERNPRRNAERDAKDYETILNGMILFEMMRNDKRSWVEILMGREKLERNSDKVIDFCSKHSILGEKYSVLGTKQPYIWEQTTLRSNIIRAMVHFQSTRIGALVNELRKKTGEEWPVFNKKCRALIKSWQKIAEVVGCFFLFLF